MEQNNIRIWKIVYAVCLLITLASLISIPYLYEDISGDSVPNRPKRSPPIVFGGILLLKESFWL